MALTEEQIRKIRESIESSSNKVDNNFYQRELAASERQAAQAAAARGALSEGQYQRANQAVNVGDILTAQILSNMQQGAYNQPKQSTVSQQARSRFASSPLTGATTVTDSFRPMASFNNNQPQPAGPVSTTPKVLGSTSSVTRAMAARQNIDYLQNEINNADNYYQNIASKVGLPGAAQAAMQAQMESAARKDSLSKALQAAYGEYTTAAKNSMDEADSYLKEYEVLDKQEEKLTAEYVRAREEALDMGVADTEHLRQVLEQQQQVRSRKQQLRQMADEAKSFYYASAQMEDGFYEIGRYRPEIKDETYKLVNGDPQAVAAAYGKLKAKDTLQDDELPLTQLTDDEKRIYNYLYMQEGKEAAQKFLDYITPYLRNRLAEKQYGEMNGVQKALYWLPAGMDQWARGIENFGALVKGSENVAPSTTALQSGMVREEAYDKSKVLGTFYDIGQITANQIPNLLLGYATGGVAEAANMSQLGATVLAKTVQGASTLSSTGGNYYQEALAEGLDVSQARSYALLSGAAEAGLESVLGGFEKITGVGTDKIAKLAGGIKNGLLRAVATAGAEGLGEGIEEGLQDILSPLFKNILTHSKDYDIDWAGVGQSFIMGALSTVPMNATTSGAEAIIKRAAVGEHTYFDGFNELMGNGVPDYYKGLAGVDEIQQRMDKLSKNTQMTATEKFQAQKQGTYLMAAYEAIDKMQAQIEKEQTQPEAVQQPASGENINKNVDNINVGVDERTVTNGQTGNNVLNGSGQRNVGIGAGEQTGAVAAGTGTVQGRPRNAVNQGATVNGRQAVLNDYVRAGGQLTSTTGKAAGIRAATDATLEIWTPELIAKDKELSQIVETNKSRGIETVITNGGVEVNAGIDDATGEKITKRANGIYTIDKNGKVKIFIDAMSSAYTATQLNEHETFHALVGTDPTLKSKALRKVAQSMSGDELRKVLEGYVRQYSGVYDGKVDNAFMAAMADGEAIIQDAAARNILEEVAADAYADINRHGDLGTLKETVRTEVESQQAANQTAQTPRETRGPPEESRYLLSETTDGKPVTPNESEVKEKFSLDEPVEYTKDFVALHNITEDNLLASIKLGGLPSPSIAIVDAKQGHSEYGPISLVFRSETIDPEFMRQNKVYGSDAWTPTASNARVDYLVNQKAANNLEHLIYDLSGQIANGMFRSLSTLRSLGVEDDTTDNAKELARRLSHQDAVKAAYLAGNNKNVELVYQLKKYGQWGNEFSQMLIDGFGYQQLAAMVARIETNEGLTEQELEQFREMWAENKYDTYPQRIKERNGEEVVRKKARNLANDLWESQIEHAVKDAWEMYSDDGKVSDEIDRNATQRNLSKAAPDEEVAEWILPEVEKILGEPGIYNGKDKYTNSGASRSFKQLHWEYTAENILKAMQKAESRGANYWGVGGEGLTAVASTDFKSIDQMHQEENRLMQESDETRRARLEELDEMISDIIPDIRNTNKMHSSYEWEENDIIGTVMMQAAQVARTPAAIQKAFAKEGYTINAETTQKLLDMYNQAAQIPTGYFEAKPQRVVGFDEVVAAVVPDNMSVKTYNELTNAGVDVKLYPTGDEQARLDTINGLENIRFSLDEPVEYTDDLIAMHNLSVDNAIRTLQNEGMPSPSIAIKNASMGHNAFGEITFLFGRDTVDPQADKRNEIYESDAYTATYPKTKVIDEVDIALVDALNSGTISDYNYDTVIDLIITAAQEIQQAIETLEPGQESPKEGRTGYWSNDTTSKAALYLLAHPSNELFELLPEKDVFDLDYDDYWFLGDDLRRMVQSMSAEEKSKAEAWVDNRVLPQGIEEIAAQMQRKPLRTDVPQVNTIDELRTLSSERAAEGDRSYAEAKPRRAVYSEEIVGAVLPDVFEDSADFFKYLQLQMLLSENGVPVSYYDKNEKQSRLEAINDLADSYPSIRFSFAGESALTANDETRREAEHLEMQGLDMNYIRQETGWFKGDDGKWRFEIDDSQMTLKPTVDEIRGETWWRIGDLIDNPALFKAYPAMAYKYVGFANLSKGVKGEYNRAEDEIHLSRNLLEDPEELLDTLTHELQHMIQQFEKFASGANTSYWQNEINKGFDTRPRDLQRKQQEAKEALNEIKANDPEFYADMIELKRSVPDMPRGKILDWNTLESEPDPQEWVEYDAKRDALEEKYGDKVWYFISTYDKAVNKSNYGTRSAEELYYNTAGEIEARQAQWRRGLTAEERRNKPVELGGDYAVFATGISGYSASEERFSIEDEPTTITRAEFARNVMNLFQIPKVAQEDWISKTAQFADLVLKNPEAAEQYENAIYNTLIGEGQRKTAADEQSAYTLKQLRNSRVYVPDSVKSDINRDNWDAYRRAAMAQKIYYTNNPNDTGLDAWAQDTLAGIDPRFKNVTDPADVLELMNTVIDEGKPKIRTVAEQFAADNNMDQAQAEQGLRDDLHDLVENLITQSRLEQQLRAGNYYQRQERKIKKMQTAAEVAQAQMVEAQNRLNQQQTALDTQQETMRQREDDLIRRETALEWKNISHAIPDATPEQLIAVAEDMRANGVYTLDDYLNRLTLNDLMASNEPEAEIGEEYSPEERRAMEKMAERKRNEGIGDISPELQKAMDAMGAKNVNDYMRILDNKSKEEHAERVRTKLREEFKGTELMNKYGVQIAGTLTDYSDVQMLRGRDKAYYDAKRAADKAIKRLRPTEQEEQYARLISNGIMDYQDFNSMPAGVDRVKVNELIDYYDALRALSVDIIANRKRQINDQLIDETMPEIFKNTDTYKPLTSWQLEHSTPTRIARRMFGEDANKVISEVFDPIAANDAGKMRFVNGIVEKMSKFTDGNGKKTKLNSAENELVAMMLDNALDNKPFELEADGRRQVSAEAEAAGRLMANLDDKGRIKGDRKTWEQIEKKLQKELERKNLKSLPAEEMRKAEYIATELRYKALENGIDKVHVKNAVEAYKTLYNELYDIQNDFYVAHGFHGIGFQKNYNPRMQPETVKRALSDMAQMLGIKESTGGIPASIAGLTSEFKPSKRWNAHDQSRTDNMTTYFAAQESLDNYLSYLSDILYHTDDIMRIRAMEKYFRAQYAPDMIREEMSHVRELARGSIAEQRAYLEDKGIIKHTDVLSDADITLAMDKYIEDRYANMNDTTTMGKFTAWAKNYGDILAGKQSMADRSWEYSYGRETLNTGNRLLNTFARSAVAASLTSTLNQTSQLPMILNDIGPRYTAQALAEIATGKLRKIDFTSQSDYLTENRASTI